MKLATINLLIASFLVFGATLLAEEVLIKGTERHIGRSEGDTFINCVGDEVEIKDGQISEKNEKCPDGRDMLTVQQEQTAGIPTASVVAGTGVIVIIALLIIIL
ncbi:MAG: hypothetical protein AB1461_05925 [Thermodesulfobacteriota bacterium]